MAEEDRPPIWSAFCTALGTEYRDAKEIVGASGITHPIEAVGVDDKGKRLVLVSGEYSPRIAALMRVDVQATMQDVRVLVARPLALDLAHAARKMFFTEQGTLDVNSISHLTALTELGESEGGVEEFMKATYGPTAASLFESVKRSKLPVRAHVLNLVDQLTSLNWERLSPQKHTQGMVQTAVDVLMMFSAMDNLAADRAQGICPVPTYELTDDDWDLFHNPKHIEEVRNRLRELEIYQYFYPPADSLTLGLIDNGFSTSGQIATGIEVAAQQGHEVSDNAFLSEVMQLPDMIEELKANGYAAEGEFSMELTEEGRALRSVVKVRPSESLFKKISHVFSVKFNIDLKDFLSSK